MYEVPDMPRVDHVCEEYARATFGKRVTELTEENRQLRKTLAAIEDARLKAHHFDVLLKAIKENPSVKDYWDKIMMIMKLENL